MTACPHGPGCQRLHVGDVARVVHGPQLGYQQLGEVVDVDGGAIRLRFLDGVDGLVEPDLELHYFESELHRESR